ncbi:MAG: hypothetical protein H7Z72_00290 [Bacteroidetes bacterium]|nr:hypothetical protein [Fibrella sp.]
MISLVKISLGIFLIGLSHFKASKSARTAPEDHVLLGLNETARIGTDLIVHVDSLIDSRCPADVDCFWAGQAAVTLSLSKNAETQMRRFYVAGSALIQADSTTVQFDSTQYRIVLKDVIPYPAKAVNQLNRRAVIRITKL